MKFIPGNSYHVFNQGNNQECLFSAEHHYLHFLELFQSYVLPHCHILCWCLMPNHFHFLLHTDTRVTKIKKQGGLVLDPLTNGFRKLLSAYSHKYNLQNNRTGALFRPKTKAKCITEEAIIKETGLSNQEYFIQCFHYIHNNPLAAGLVELPEQWKWSSCRFYLNQSDETLTLADETPARSDETSDQHSFCNKELAYKFLGIEEGFVR